MSHLSQEMLAKELDVAFATVNCWKTGSTSPPFCYKSDSMNTAKETGQSLATTTMISQIYKGEKREQHGV